MTRQRILAVAAIALATGANGVTYRIAASTSTSLLACQAER